MRRVVGETGVRYVKIDGGWRMEEVVSRAPRGRRDAFPPYPVSPEPEDLTEGCAEPAGEAS